MAQSRFSVKRKGCFDEDNSVSPAKRTCVQGVELIQQDSGKKLEVAKVVWKLPERIPMMKKVVHPTKLTLAETTKMKPIYNRKSMKIIYKEDLRIYVLLMCAFDARRQARLRKAQSCSKKPQAGAEKAKSSVPSLPRLIELNLKEYQARSKEQTSPKKPQISVPSFTRKKIIFFHEYRARSKEQ